MGLFRGGKFWHCQVQPFCLPEGGGLDVRHSDINSPTFWGPGMDRGSSRMHTKPLLPCLQPFKIKPNLFHLAFKDLCEGFTSFFFLVTYLNTIHTHITFHSDVCWWGGGVPAMS